MTVQSAVQLLIDRSLIKGDQRTTESYGIFLAFGYTVSCLFKGRASKWWPQSLKRSLMNPNFNTFKGTQAKNFLLWAFWASLPSFVPCIVSGYGKSADKEQHFVKYLKILFHNYSAQASQHSPLHDWGSATPLTACPAGRALQKPG